MIALDDYSSALQGEAIGGVNESLAGTQSIKHKEMRNQSTKTIQLQNQGQRNNIIATPKSDCGS